jgi:catalase
VKPEPDNEVPQGQSAHNNFWDFAYMHKETTHMLFWQMSDRGIPRSYRMIQGFGVNTFSLINAKNERTFVKFVWTPELGVHSLVWDEALKLAGQDPDFHRKDLWEAIENGAYAKWKFGWQQIKEADMDKFEFDILDATKVWPEELVPIRYVGELELNRNVDEYFAETEQVAFCTSHIVPGIDFSDDPLLQGRNFSYQDTQLSRLGTNWEELPINRPVCPVMNFNRDGQGRHTISKGKANYWPNRFEANPPADHSGANGLKSYPAKIQGVKSRSIPDSKKWKDYISQAQLFLNSMSAVERAHIISAFSFELDHCDDDIVYERMVARLAEIDLSLAQAVAEKAGAKTPEKQLVQNHGKKAKGLSQFNYMPKEPTIKGRRIAILMADGFDFTAYEAMKAAAFAQSAVPWTIGVKRQAMKSTSGKEVKADHFLNGQRSTMFDALFIPGGHESIKTLTKIALARFWVKEAFGHLKAIAASAEGIQLVHAALTEVQDVKLATEGSEGVTNWYGVVTSNKSETASSVKNGVKIVSDSQDFTGTFFWEISQHRNFARELDGYAEQVSI